MADISSLSVFAAIQDSGLRITFDTNIYGTCYKNFIISREGFLSA